MFLSFGFPYVSYYVVYEKISQGKKYRLSELWAAVPRIRIRNRKRRPKPPLKLSKNSMQRKNCFPPQNIQTTP
jgi:hypothetical protein